MNSADITNGKRFLGGRDYLSNLTLDTEQALYQLRMHRHYCLQCYGLSGISYYNCHVSHTFLLLFLKFYLSVKLRKLCFGLYIPASFLYYTKDYIKYSLILYFGKFSMVHSWFWFFQMVSKIVLASGWYT